MGSQSELSLDYKPNGHRLIPKPLWDLPEQTQNLEEFLARLEEERLKIEAFKRELPLCMQLLNNAMEAYRQQLETQQTNHGRMKPVLEEFIPIENMNVDGSEKVPNAPSEKANWMISAQLWSPAIDATVTKQTTENEQSSFNMSPKPALDTKQRGFLPFSKVDKNKGAVSAPRPLLPELALGSPEKDEDSKSSEMERRESNCTKARGVSVVTEQTKGEGASQTHRKARRCWSPDLHRRFVNALQILGGSQVATPKQIRELMKVDGLTNDEVKSHLQKYRLHTRRPIPPPQAAAAPPQLVVLGGIWVPSDYAASAAAGQAIYGAHPSQAHYAAVPQDFYTAQPVPHHHHHHYHHRSAATPLAYKGRTPSPESDLRSAGEQSESIEEATVERGEEAEEEEEEGEETEDEEEREKAMVEVKDSNGGSDVALKF